MTNPGMIMSDGTGTAIKASASSLCATILAMFWEFGGRADLSPMLLLVTRNAQSFSVIDVCYQFGVFRNWLYVVGMHIVTALAASLASVAIASIDGVAPFRQVSSDLGALAMQRFSTLPDGRFFTRQRFPTARPGAKSGALVAAIKRLATVFTISRHRRISVGPTLFGAKTRCSSPVRLGRVRCSAQLANFNYLRVFHGFIIPHSTQITKPYCAVAIQRWVDLTGRQPTLLPD